MSVSAEQLNLNENYSFDVIAHTEDDHFVAHLSLSPNKITLRVMGELYEGRGKPPSWNNQAITCSDGNAGFVLFGLKAMKSRQSVIPPRSKKRGFFEISYEADYLIYSNNRIDEGTEFSALTVRSDTINDWLGNTTKQEEILTEYHSDPTLKNISVDEFEHKIENLGRIGMAYHPQVEFNSPQYKSGLSFPPYLYIVFDESKSKYETVGVYNQLHNLFVFLTGDEINLSKIELSYRQSMSNIHNSIAWLYYPTEKFPKRYNNASVLFPRNTSLRHQFIESPELPHDVFNLYFNSQIDERTHTSWYIEHYNIYRRRAAIEERFLGYYRLLEKLCALKSSYADPETLELLLKKARAFLKKRLSLNSKNVDGLIGKIKIANQQKYNSEKQILEFYRSLPQECIDGWRVKQEDIETVVNLRNDITHANEHDTDNETLEEYTKFVEVLLIFALSEKLGVNFEHTQSLIPRLKGYHFLRDMSEGITIVTPQKNNSNKA